MNCSGKNACDSISATTPSRPDYLLDARFHQVPDGLLDLRLLHWYSAGSRDSGPEH